MPDTAQTAMPDEVAVELSCQLTGQSQHAVGAYYGYCSDSSVVRQRQRLRRLMNVDEKLARRVERLRKRVLRER